jgi:heterodisulfide reductase subunit A-like polyferredoxin
MKSKESAVIIGAGIGDIINAVFLAKKGYELFQIFLKKLIERNLDKLSDYIKMENALLLICLKAYASHSKYVEFCKMD